MTRLRLRSFAPAILLALAAHSPAQEAPPAAQVPAAEAAPPVPVPPPVDLLGDPAAWSASASEEVRSAARVDGGHSACLDFDFGKVSGYATLARALPLDLPPRYELRLRLHGEAPANELQFKFVDESGDNVWWMRRSAYAPVAAGEDLRVRQREISFAWGPAQDRSLHRSARLELTVSRSEGGGRGALCLDSLVLVPLAPAPAATAPVAVPSSAGAGAEGSRVLEDGKLDPPWDAPGAGGAFTLDLGAARESGGIVLRWARGHAASEYEVQASDDGSEWRTVRAVRGALRETQHLALPGLESRWIRVRVPATTTPLGPRLESFSVRDPAFAEPNALLAAVARDAPRGFWPRSFLGEQPYWTIAGTPAPARGSAPALVSEDGAIEASRGGWSVEPFLAVDGQWITWAQAQISHSLPEGYLPMPRVRWHTQGGVDLEVSAFAQGEGNEALAFARYRVRNTGASGRKVRLALAVRPLQVDPATQFLNGAGGAHPIHDLSWEWQSMKIDGEAGILAVEPPSYTAFSTFLGGPVVERLEDATARGAGVHDEDGFASGALVYELDLAAGAEQTIDIVMPLAGSTLGNAPRSAAHVAARERAAAAGWHRALDAVQLRLPREAWPIADTLRTALAHILASRDGPALQPGTRSYARSWIRDGAMMNEALLRLGHAREAREFLEWFAPFQYESGKVPCCADARGSDPVPENDSAGEFLFAVAELYRFGDREVAARMWPRVVAAQAYLDRLRAQERARADPRPEVAGLLPASISHEGYSAKPMHSYWDDFWALRGYEDAAWLARELGHEAEAQAFGLSAREFKADLLRSIGESARVHAIDYIPGAAELGDFDATSTTVALSPGDLLADIPPALLAGTFDRYWKFAQDRASGARAWEDYTPYELRTVASMVRLGERERAQALLGFFFHDQRPQGWNQWAEVVGSDPRKPRFIGDMPHAWVASDYIRSALDLFAMERSHGAEIVLAAGVPRRWLERDGIAVTGLHTATGTLSYAMRSSRSGLHLRIDARPRARIFVPVPGTGPRVLWIGDRRIDVAADVHEVAVP